eukprot:GHVU01141570.1.p1 GENE.GHVU01141570.1~~GHVU01141570.1.p1  ORF type:complete len:101 (+),score=1.95 GHVU01141570.1:231-533(+)
MIDVRDVVEARIYEMVTGREFPVPGVNDLSQGRTGTAPVHTSPREWDVINRLSRTTPEAASTPLQPLVPSINGSPVSFGKRLCLYVCKPNLIKTLKKVFV